MKNALKISLAICAMLFMSACATPNAVAHDSKVAWDGTKKASGEVWEGTKDASGKAWEGTKKVSGEAWDDTKKAVNNATSDQ